MILSVVASIVDKTRLVPEADVKNKLPVDKVGVLTELTVILSVCMFVTNKLFIVAFVFIMFDEVILVASKLDRVAVPACKNVVSTLEAKKFVVVIFVALRCDGVN